MTRDLACPICDAEVPLTGDERHGDELSCGYCRAPLKVCGDDEERELVDDL